MKCKHCGADNRDSAKFCDSCGQSLEIKAPQAEIGENGDSTGLSKKHLLMCIGAAAVMMAAVAVFALMNGNSTGGRADKTVTAVTTSSACSGEQQGQ